MAVHAANFHDRLKQGCFFTIDAFDTFALTTSTSSSSKIVKIIKVDQINDEQKSSFSFVDIRRLGVIINFEGFWSLGFHCNKGYFA